MAMRMRVPERGAAEEPGISEKLVHINRVAKVVKGGRRFHFNALVVVGDGQGRLGVGLGKAREVPEAIRKGGVEARKGMFQVVLKGSTVPHPVEIKYGATRVIIKPAAPGTGIIAGSGVRAVMEAVGIKDVLTKALGSSNPINVTKAAAQALRALKDPQEQLVRRGLRPALAPPAPSPAAEPKAHA